MFKVCCRLTRRRDLSNTDHENWQIHGDVLKNDEKSTDFSPNSLVGVTSDKVIIKMVDHIVFSLVLSVHLDHYFDVLHI